MSSSLESLLRFAKENSHTPRQQKVNNKRLLFVALLVSQLICCQTGLLYLADVKMKTQTDRDRHTKLSVFRANNEVKIRTIYKSVTITGYI